MELEIENLTKQYGKKWQFRMSHVLLNRELLDFLGQTELEKVPL